MYRVGLGQYTNKCKLKKCYPVKLSFIYKAITTTSVLVYLKYYKTINNGYSTNEREHHQKEFECYTLPPYTVGDNDE